MDDNNHIGIEIPDNLPEVYMYNLVEDLKVDKLNLKILKRPQLGPMAALELVVPTIMAAYIFKPYFESFLKEAGKDHYTILRGWLKKFVSNGKLINVHTIYAPQSVNKNSINNTQSKTISLLLQTKNGKVIKLLFDNDLEKDDWDSAIDQLLDFAVENYEKYPNDNLTKKIEQLEIYEGDKIYAIIDKENKNLNFYNINSFLLIKKKVQENDT